MPEEITRAEAKASGIPHYFTGKPCKNGHVDLRYTGRGTCRSCNAIFHRAAYKRDPERHREYRKRFYYDNLEKEAASSKRYRAQNPFKPTPEQSIGRSVNRKNRRKTDLNYRLSEVLRCRVWHGISKQRAKRSARTIELIGCTYPELRVFLENKFMPGMSWANYGHGRDKWNVDHIRPVSSFDLTDPRQQRECFHHSNLQPLWQPDNFRKGSKWDRSGPVIIHLYELRKIPT